MIPRTLEPVLTSLARQFPVVTVTGPRQSGKTTLCRKAFPDLPYANLESHDTREFARSDPRGFLAPFREGAVIDEIQRVPELTSYLQPLVDRPHARPRFILTGSRQLEVGQTVTQSLAGRTALLKLLPLSLEELGRRRPESIDQMLVSGSYPRIHAERVDPAVALSSYFETYVERDIRQVIRVKDLHAFETFVKLCAGRVGQLLNLQNLGAEAGVSHTTARSWLTVLEAGFVVFLLPPFHRNLNKRLVKSPKLYFHDVGLAAHLLGIETPAHVSRHPLRGHLFENLMVTEALKYRFHRGRRSNLSFFRDARGNEVDLVMEFGERVFPVEIKAGATIAGDFFQGLRTFQALVPETPWGGGLIYAGGEGRLQDGIQVTPWPAVASLFGCPREDE